MEGKKNLSINFSCDDLVMIFVLGRACSNCCYCELVNRFFSVKAATKQRLGEVEDERKGRGRLAFNIRFTSLIRWFHIE